MKQIKVALCFLDEEDNIISKRCIESKWSVDLEHNIKEYFNIDVKDEIVSVMIEAIKVELTPKMIKEMLDELENK